jgi:uncharacterized damage-inducible protein DinB
MDVAAVLVDAFGRVEESMRRTLDGLTPEQLVLRPKEQANTIGWLAWHLTRVQDDHVSDLAGKPQTWIAEGWHARFDRAEDPDDTGFRHTPSQVAALRPSSAQLLVDYYTAVHQRSIAYIHGLQPADLDRVLDEPGWDPPVTVGVRLVSVVNDCTQHVGQMAYVRGLIEDRRWFPW